MTQWEGSSVEEASLVAPRVLGTLQTTLALSRTRLHRNFFLAAKRELSSTDEALLVASGVLRLFQTLPAVSRSRLQGNSLFTFCCPTLGKRSDRDGL